MAKQQTGGAGKSSKKIPLPANQSPAVNDYAFLSGGGTMGTLMRSLDWSTTAVGAIETWPPSLRTAINIVLNSSFPMFIWWDKEHLVNFYNDAYVTILGDKHPNSLGKSGYEAWKEIWNDVGPLAEHVLTTGASQLMENMPLLMNRHGYEEQTYFTFSYSPIRDESGAVAGMICACFETTTSFESQASIQASEERYKAFIANSSEGIWRIELEQPVPVSLPVAEQIEQFYSYGYLAECNDTMAHMYGFGKPDELIGARLGDLLIKEDQGNIDYLTAFIQSDYKLTEVESHEKDVDGNDKYFSNSLVGVTADNVLLRAWGVQQDVTARKTLEQQKDEFIGIASHELKTPVTSLKVYTQALYKKLTKAGNVEMASHVVKMDKQLDKLISLISDLLDVTKIESGRLQFKESVFTINDLVYEIVADLQQTEQKHAIEVQVAANKKLYGNRDRIGQVVTNLLTNAIKYSPPGQKVIVTTKVSGKTLSVCVQDFGIGIPAEKQSHVFERFYRVEDREGSGSYGGLGLGLYISAEIIKRHGGKIWVESEPGKGSKFCFSLPLKRNS